MSRIVDQITPDCMVLFNESFAATNEREGSEIARQAGGAVGATAAVLERGGEILGASQQTGLALLAKIEQYAMKHEAQLVIIDNIS